MQHGRMVSPRSILAVAALVFAAAACDDDPTEPAAGPTAGVEEHRARNPNRSAPPPAGLASVQATTGEVILWPFTGSDVYGTDTDPVNLVFAGQADPRQIRAALMALDGDRTSFGMPAAYPFNCTWSDTPSGDVQTTYTDSAGWQGSAIQLQCGDYAPVRFHLRLWRHLGVALGGAHFEVLIPGTTNHQVLSWELAEQLVTADMVRSGLLGAAPSASGAINPAPSYRTIPAIIYNGLPADLQFLVTGAPGSVTADVPIATDGNATLLFLASAPTVRRDQVNRTFTIDFNQVIPKPFCGGPADFVYVQGPVTFRERARLGWDGNYHSAFHASGRLTVVPVDPLSGQPLGQPLSAEVLQLHDGDLTDEFQRASLGIIQLITPAGASGAGRLRVRLVVDSRGTAEYFRNERCGR